MSQATVSLDVGLLGINVRYIFEGSASFNCILSFDMRKGLLASDVAKFQISPRVLYLTSNIPSKSTFLFIRLPYKSC